MAVNRWTRGLGLGLAAVLMALACGRAALTQPSASGPSFDCTRATSQANRTICATPDLAALDRELSNVFINTLGQASTDPKALRAEEAAWLTGVRNRCADAACLRAAYRSRIAALKDRSLRAASPAAYAETRPFPAPAALLAEARALVGKPCGGYFAAGGGPQIRGFSRVPGFSPVILNGAVAAAGAKAGARFVFLLVSSGDKCRVADVAALPPARPREAFLACSVPPGDGVATSDSIGVGLRQIGKTTSTAYWEVDAQGGELIRQPLGVLGWDHRLRCEQPEGGE
jgi:uncharacterized protein YecT (DUF1311 family)